MRRFRIASDLGPSAAEDARSGKRQRLARTVSGSCTDAGSVSRQTASGVPERWPRYGVTSVCGRRREMEDAISIRPDFLPGSSKYHFFGVFDDHGCSHVATTCQDRMHEVVAEEHKKAGSGEEAAWKEVMDVGTKPRKKAITHTCANQHIRTRETGERIFGAAA